jgi:hypothetical protein
MKTIEEVQRTNWLQFSNLIDARKEPLGVGLKNQCFIGLAVEVAKSNNQSLADRFGFSVWELRGDIRDSEQTKRNERNLAMAQRAREIGISGNL